MTIKIYPSRMPGEPLETHHHKAMTLHHWFARNVKEYTLAKIPPFVVEIAGRNVPQDEWKTCELTPDSDVHIYPIPYGTGLEFAAWAAIAVAVASAAYSIFMMSSIDAGSYTSSTGKGLDLNPAEANSAKLGSAIREVFGRTRVYPDYVVSPVTRFDTSDPTIMRISMLICVGMGYFSFTDGDIRIGDTPALSLPGFDYTVHHPGADVSGDDRSENWFSSTEVGGTTSGSGLDMAQTAPKSDDIIADSMTVSGASVSFTGLDTDDDNETNDDDEALPDSWVEGGVVEIIAPTTFTVSSSSGYSVLSSGFLSEINPHVGMPVTMTYGSIDYQLCIASYTPSQDAVPGVGGSAASVQASAAPITYDFSTSAATFDITWQGTTYTISLIADYVTMSGLVAAITEALGGSGLAAQDTSGTVLITEPSSPYAGGSIMTSSLPSSVFGSSPVNTSGATSSGGSAAVTASVTLAYDSATGTAFTGVPTGQQRLSVSHRGYEYQIVSVSGATTTVQRLIDGMVDETWSGFSSRTMIDYEASGINDNDTWMGPFLACPENEICDTIEVNFSFPSGICGFNSKGKKQSRTVEWEIQYRVYGSGSGWLSHTGKYSLKNINGLGFTERITPHAPGLIEVRCRRLNEQGSSNARDSMFWQALRGRLLSRPSSYEGVTLMGVTVESGGKLAAQSDRRVNVVVTRQYDTGTARTISGALLHVGNSLGLDMDEEAIATLEIAHWTPNGDYFDYSADSSSSDSSSALDMLQKITNAGKSYFLLNDGLASVGLEGVKTWTGIISPQETTEHLETSFSAPSDDDYDGVDVTYINGITWAEETVQCRLPGNPTPSKVEAYSLDGVHEGDKAYQIGMRRLMKYLNQRLTHTATTELDALCYNVGDRIILTDDIPGNKTVSCLILAMSTTDGITTFSVSELLDWTLNNPRAVLRFQDGTVSSLLVATEVGDYDMSVPHQSVFDEIVLGHPSIEPPRLIFCDSSRVGYDALITEISPQSDGTCQVTAKEYRASFYDYDNATYPGDVA
ncbi:kinase [Rahnella aceris]|uniref:host specificity factor TipJ family phage tail protein n=1 Tax=Rahnella sp. (strain Y9602) TaxID=2703885 RepID=UPI0019035FB8|nr:host specificity factor TipJ family phage tail protein [Rahnella aceris]QQN35699.1 kinase [Rahnella aceris]